MTVHFWLPHIIIQRIHFFYSLTQQQVNYINPKPTQHNNHSWYSTNKEPSSPKAPQQVITVRCVAFASYFPINMIFIRSSFAIVIVISLSNTTASPKYLKADMMQCRRKTKAPTAGTSIPTTTQYRF